MRTLTQWILGPVWQGILIATICYLLPYFELFALVIMALITLRQGMVKGLVVGLGSSLIGVSLGFLIAGFYTEVDYQLYVASLQWTLTLVLPLWAFAGMLRKTVSLNVTIQAVTLVFMATFMFLYSANINILPELLRQPVVESVQNLTDSIVTMQKNSNLEDVLILTPENIIEVNKFLLNIFEVVTVYTVFILMLFLARVWQAVMFKPGGFKEEFINLRAGKFVNTILVSIWLIIMLLSKQSSLYLFGGVLLIGSIWLFISGVALFHWVASVYKLPWGLLAVFYLSLLLPVLSGILMLTLIMIGLIDGFVDLRSYIYRLSHKAGS